MSEAHGFVLHPLAAQDITDIWESLAEQNPPAASRVREAILISPIKATGGLTSPRALCGSPSCGTI